jgi:hypothetical protein
MPASPIIFPARLRKFIVGQMALTRDAIISALEADDFEWVLAQQQDGLTPASKLNSFPHRQIIVDLSNNNLVICDVVSKTSLLLVAAYYGARRCFSFFFANDQMLYPDARLHQFAYHGGNLQIISMVHIRYGPNVDDFPWALVGGHLNAFLSLANVFPSWSSITFLDTRRVLALGVPLDALGDRIMESQAMEVLEYLMSMTDWKRINRLFTSLSLVPSKLEATLGGVFQQLALSKRLFEYPEFCEILFKCPYSFWGALCCHNALQTLRFLCDTMPGILTRRFDDAPDYPTLLHFAAAYGRSAVMQELTVLDDLDPNEPNVFGRCPIHLAIQYSGPVEALLTHPFIELSGIVIGTPPLLAMIRSGLMIEAFYRHPRLNLLEEQNGRMILSELAFSKRSVDFIHWLFTELYVLGSRRSVLDINAIDSNRKTLLHYAVEVGNEVLVSRILKHPGFMPYLGRMSGVLLIFFWLKSLYRQHRRLNKCSFERSIKCRVQGNPGEATLYFRVPRNIRRRRLVVMNVARQNSLHPIASSERSRSEKIRQQSRDRSR